MTSVLLVDPHPLTRQGLTQALQAEGDLSVRAVAATADEALARFDATVPDLVITEIHLPGASGLELVSTLRARRPQVRVVVVARHEQALCAERALRAGAHGYVTSHDGSDVVVEAVRAVLKGGYYVSAHVNSLLLEALAHRPEPLVASPADVLSDRELQLFEMLGHGRSTHEIADQMGVSVKTVESYRNRAKVKLGVPDMTMLLRRAVLWVSEDRVCWAWQGCGAEAAGGCQGVAHPAAS